MIVTGPSSINIIEIAVMETMHVLLMVLIGPFPINIVRRATETIHMLLMVPIQVPGGPHAID